MVLHSLGYLLYLNEVQSDLLLAIEGHPSIVMILYIWCIRLACFAVASEAVNLDFVIYNCGAVTGPQLLLGQHTDSGGVCVARACYL